jgi:hypothetical protein
MVRTSLRDGDLAPHQKNAVWRILQGGSPLLAPPGLGEKADVRRAESSGGPVAQSF